MNCLECSQDGKKKTTAIAVCGRCGAGLCAGHLHEGGETLTFMAPIARKLAVEPLARRVRCGRCESAEKAQAAGRARGGRL